MTGSRALGCKSVNLMTEAKSHIGKIETCLHRVRRLLVSIKWQSGQDAAPADACSRAAEWGLWSSKMGNDDLELAVSKRDP